MNKQEFSYGVNQAWDVEINKSTILLGRAATMYKYDGTTTVLPAQPNPYILVTPYYSNVYNQNRVGATIFSSKSDISTVYLPMLFSADVDLSNETILKDFILINGTIKTGLTVTKDSIG